MRRGKKLVVICLGVLIVLLIGVIGVLFWKYQQAVNEPPEKAQETSARIIDRVSAIYLVPTGEEPTVAQIQDKSKLSDQAFFKKAQNGDYLLIYKKEKIAIVYRENANKLVTVGPIDITEDQGQQGQTAGAETEAGETPAPQP